MNSDLVFVFCLLCISFLQQGAPKLIRLTGTCKIQLVVIGREKIVNDHFFPFSKVPEVKFKQPTVIAWLKRLLWRTNLIEEILELREICKRRNEPTVANSSLGYVKTIHATNKKFWISDNFLVKNIKIEI